MNYSEILDTVNIWTEDDETARFDTYLRLVEADMDRRLRTVDQMTTAVSVATEGQEEFGVPSDFLSFRHISMDGKHLEYLTPDQFIITKEYRTSGTSRYYTLVGSGLQIAPAAAADAEMSIAYYAKIPELSTTNWVGDKYPDVYVYGCLEQAFSFHMDDAREQKFNAKYNVSLDELVNADRTDKWSSTPLSAKAPDYVI